MKNFQIKNFALAAVMLVAAAGCDKGGDPVDVDSPAYHIAQSEKVILPDAVKLPLNAPKGNTRVLTVYAEGFQKYKAVSKGGDPDVFEWVFVAPLADLFDIHNNKVGTHSIGPSWQLSPSDSIFAQQFTPAKTAPSPDGSGVDWLLLMPKAGKTPTGVFADVAYIQRIATKGGKAPTTPPANISSTVNVPYTAIYRFSKIKQ
jgi:hypothetical protein